MLNMSHEEFVHKHLDTEDLTLKEAVDRIVELLDQIQNFKELCKEDE